MDALVQHFYIGDKKTSENVKVVIIVVKSVFVQSSNWKNYSELPWK